MKVQDLPSEILFRIFSFVTTNDLALNVSRVCAHWNSFATEEYLWKYHCLVRWRYLKQTLERLDDPQTPWLSYFKSNLDRKHLSFLVLGAEGGGKPYNERLLDVQQKLKSSGLVNVDTLNVHTQSPSLNLLRSYNAVMIFSYHGFDQKHVGDVLADFVDLGGGVVTCAYTNCGRGNRLSGRWAKGQYDPLVLGATSRAAYLRMGTVHCPSHPILKGVQSFNGGDQSSHGDGRTHPDAQTIAEWTNGHPLIVELGSHRGAVVTLNLYPPSRDSAPGGWDPESDGGLLLANALYYVATKPA